MDSLQALFGGTFDPIHYGHLLTAETLANQIGLNQVTLLPNNIPPHRPQPKANISQRVRMLELAIADRPLFNLDMRELKRQSPSWIVETLEQFRREIGTSKPIAFIIGQDSLLSIHKWHRWEELLDLCHLLVCQRPPYPREIPAPKLQRWLMKHQVHDASILNKKSAGLIWLADTPFIPISATTIRYRRFKNIPCDNLLPDSVIDYMNYQGLYHSSRCI